MRTSQFLWSERGEKGLRFWLRKEKSLEEDGARFQCSKVKN